jgi:uncharacterized protein
LLMLKDYLEKKGEICHYFNLENPDYLKIFNEHPFKIFELVSAKKTRQYFFVDEIQYLNDPSNFLKLLYDEKRKDAKIVCSGSSSFYIDKNFRDSLAGRKFLFELYPLNFDEFLQFKGEKDLLKQKDKKMTTYYREKLSQLWQEYITFGSYPKVVLSENEELRRINLEEIASSYVKKDIADAGIRNQEKYFALLKILAEQTGSLVNLNELSGTLGIARKTVDEYTYVIGKSYQAAFIKPFFKSFRKELVKMPKCYFFDLGLRNHFLGNFESLENRADKGALAENVFFRELLRRAGRADRIRFWRTQDGREVDFVFGENAWEIKYNSRKVSSRKYEFFGEQYPNIKFRQVSFEKMPEDFYGFDL